MKAIALTLIAAIGVTDGFGQWTTSGTDIYNSNSGRVTIGSPFPFAKLTVVIPVSTSNTSGNTNAYGMMVSDYVSSTASLRSLGSGVMHFSTDALGRKLVLGGGEFEQTMWFDSGGNVGIGTSSPDQKLTVNGTVHATRVKVETTVPGPDYVFEKSYSLPSLDQVKSYIDENKHLPEIPSAKEMEAKGIDVGEMNMLLLRKIEELTLYLIEQNKVIEQLKECSVNPDPSGKKVEELTLYVIELKKENDRQQAEIDAIKKK